MVIINLLTCSFILLANFDLKPIFKDLPNEVKRSLPSKITKCKITELKLRSLLCISTIFNNHDDGKLIGYTHCIYLEFPLQFTPLFYNIFIYKSADIIFYRNRDALFRGNDISQLSDITKKFERDLEQT